MKRLKIAVLSVAGVVVVGLAIDYVVVRHKERLLSEAVSECGGRNGSIPLWPIGTEYRINLDQVPNEKQLAQLQIANDMRGWVGIAFSCEVSIEDSAKLSSALPTCHLYVTRDGALVPIP